MPAGNVIIIASVSLTKNQTSFCSWLYTHFRTQGLIYQLFAETWPVSINAKYLQLSALCLYTLLYHVILSSFLNWNNLIYTQYSFMLKGTVVSCFTYTCHVVFLNTKIHMYLVNILYLVLNTQVLSFTQLSPMFWQATVLSIWFYVLHTLVKRFIFYST